MSQIYTCKKNYAVRCGYCLKIYLPGQVTDQGNFPQKGLDPNDTKQQKIIDQQEKFFVAYAWPLVAGVSGERAFAINHLGEVYFCKKYKRRKIYLQRR